MKFLMNNKKHRFDENRPFDGITEENTTNMSNNAEINVLAQQMAALQAMIQQLTVNHTTEVNALKAQLEQVRVNSIVTHPRPALLEEISTRITNTNEVKLDVFKSLPMMGSIEPLKNTSIYSQALQIVKTKIQGAAAQVLANHGTIFNFDAIRARLDYTYADTRPLYVLQEEMKRCYQGRKTLEDFHDEINKCLSLIISKISMSGYGTEAVDAMTDQAKQDSVRVFIAGVNNTFIQSTLYGNAPVDLEHANTIARTIEHDSRHQNLKLSYDSKQPQKMQTTEPRFQPQQFKPRYQPPPKEFTPRYNNLQPRPEPMDTSSGHTNQLQPTHFNPFKTQTNHYHNQPWKRQRENELF